MELFRYTATALRGVNKTGALKADAEGHYPLVLGAFNTSNRGGAEYPWTPNVRALFASGSSFQRRVGSGALRGELGHPRKQPGQTDQQFLDRVCDIYEPNVCQLIAEVWSDDGLFRGRDGQPIIAIIGRVKPFGAQKEALLDALETPKSNAAESIRSLTEDTWTAGRLRKEVQSIITWDHVNECGIPLADKLYSPGLESATMEDFIVTRDMLDELVDRHVNGVGTESSATARGILMDIGSRPPRANEMRFTVGASTRW